MRGIRPAALDWAANSCFPEQVYRQQSWRQKIRVGPRWRSLCGDADMELTSLQRLALEACHRAKSEIGETCYKWLAQQYKDQGVNPHHLKQLQKLGYLVRAEGNSRNWYRVVKPVPTSPVTAT